MPARRALVQQEYPSLINGVSRQATPQRLTSQAEEQINCLSDVADGLTRRPPAEHEALLTGSAAGATPTGGRFYHKIDLGPGKQFVAMIEDGDISVYDLSDGSEVVVNDNATGAPGSYAYLDINTGAGETAEESFVAVTIADYTFIVNKTVTAAMSVTPSAGRENAHEMLVWVKQFGAPNNVRYDVAGTIDNTGGGAATSAAIMDQHMTMVGTSGYPTAFACTAAAWLNWTVTRESANTAYFYQDDVTGGEEAVSADDDSGNVLVQIARTGVNGEDPEVDRFSDLPAVGRDGFNIKVSGENGTDEDEFYVVYNEEGNNWRETVKPGLIDAFNADTMPHALVYDNGANEFSFEPITWANRLVGDTTSAPEPSFIGKTISDISLHDNRLLIFSGENVVASESGEFFNFWPTTVTTIVDSDPFDIAGIGPRVAEWDYAVLFRGWPTLFSTTGDTVAQLYGSRNEPLTIENARLLERASPSVSMVRPVVAGDLLFYVLDHGTFSTVEQFSEQELDLFRSDDVSAHVGNYIPTSIVDMFVSRAENILVLRPTGSSEDHRLYAYRWHVGSEGIDMASWSKWEFDSAAQIRWCDWIESVLYLLIERQDGLHLEFMDFGKSEEDSTLGYRVHLDSLFTATGSYSATTGLTTWTVPYDQDSNGGTYRVVRGGDWGTERGALIPGIVTTTDLQITAAGDYSANACYIGREYTSSYELSRIHMTPSRGGFGTGRMAGRLQLRQGRVWFEDTASFQAVVASTEDGDSYTDVFTAEGPGTLTLGQPEPRDGIHVFDIGSHAEYARITLQNSGFLPFRFSAFQWTGRYSLRR